MPIPDRLNRFLLRLIVLDVAQRQRFDAVNRQWGDMENQSFESFYRSTRDDCFRALIVAVGSPYEADELLAEAYTRALEPWSNVQEHPTPKAWVFSVATNLPTGSLEKGETLIAGVDSS